MNRFSYMPFYNTQASHNDPDAKRLDDSLDKKQKTVFVKLEDSDDENEQT